MSLIKVIKCGEVYSDSYKRSFMWEDEEYYNGKVKAITPDGEAEEGAQRCGPVLVLAVLVLAGILVGLCR